MQPIDLRSSVDLPTMVLALLALVTCLAGCVASKPVVQVTPKFQPELSPQALDKLPPPTVAELVSRGDAAYGRGEVNLAVVEYVKALVEQPGNVDLLIKIGDAQRELGQPDIAERAYREALTLRPRDAGALEGMGLILMGQRRTEDAQKNLLAALEIQPGRWRSLNALGIMADLKGDLSQAQEYYEQALAINPQASVVLNNLGYSHYLAGDSDTALRYFDAAVGADIDNRKAWSNLALIYVRRKQFDLALDSLSQIMDRAHSLNSVGYLCMITEQFDCATEHFRRAISAAPVYFSEAQINLTRVQMRQEASKTALP